MGSIQVLPPTLASQIAAGEVVDRPASALKELLENALDADATRCDIAVAGGGVELLSVRDNGHGMSPEDVCLCVERHATSKLRHFDDLGTIASFGFRGEALPSIASVSRLTVRSRRAEDAAGTEVRVIGGDVSAPRQVGMAPGTEVVVEDLFYNVPARRKFLRSSGTEAGHLAEVAEAIALANPQATITLTRDGRKAREWLRVKSRLERVTDVLGEEELVRCYGELGPLTIEAYLGRPERAKAGANGLRLFCNTRPIRDRALLQSVAQAYGSVLERGRYPRGVVYLNLPQTLVDVNVHPQKTEVRFADPRAVADAVFDVVNQELQTAFTVPIGNAGASRWTSPIQSSPSIPPYSDVPTSEPASFPSSEVRPSLQAPANRAVATFRPPPATRLPLGGSPQVSLPEPSTSSEKPSAPDAAETPSVPSVDFTPFSSQPSSGTTLVVRRVSDAGADVGWSRLKFVAQVRNLYLICEGPDGLFLLDQHAAAERVAFDKLKRQLEKDKLPSQALLFPVTISVDAQLYEAVESHHDQIARLGFELRQRPEHSVSVHQVPRLLHRADPERLVVDLLNELTRRDRSFSEGLDLVLATMACHGALRAGDPIAPVEAEALLRALDEVRFSGHCPHGRPIVTFTPWSELERKVGRR